jgi:hypothetical protein
VTVVGGFPRLGVYRGIFLQALGVLRALLPRDLALLVAAWWRIRDAMTIVVESEP